MQVDFTDKPMKLVKANEIVRYLDMLSKRMDFDPLPSLNASIAGLAFCQDQDNIGDKVLSMVEEAWHQTHEQADKNYQLYKDRCDELQKRIMAKLDELVLKLPQGYPAIHLFEPDSLVDVVQHYKYIENFFNNLQVDEYLIETRMKFLKKPEPAAMNKTNIIPLMPKEQVH